MGHQRERENDEFRSADFNVLRVDNSTMYVLLQSTLEIRQFPAQVIEMLEVCRLPRTLSEHSKALIRVGIVETALGITALLDHFVDIHLLVRSSRSGEIGASVLGAPADSTSGRTMTVAFITRDRPQHLRRALMAFGENFRRCGHSPQVVVVDASRRPDSIISTARTATAFRKEFGLAISIVGDDEKADLNRAIMRRLGRQESHESAFLLGLNSNSEESEVGASMNYLLLTCGGKLLCRVSERPTPWFTPSCKSDLVG